MDNEIQETVEAILGKDVKVLDCEKTSSIKEEEVLLINGFPVTLDGEDGIAIKQALLSGNVPSCPSLNNILIQVGILQAPVQLETKLNVKSNIVRREEVTVTRGGKIIDERSRETKEDNSYSSSTSEIWEPVGVVHRERIADSESSSTTNEFISFSSTSKNNAIAGHSNDNIEFNQPKMIEKKISSVTKKSSDEDEDQTDFVHSRQTIGGNRVKNSGLHLISLGNALDGCISNSYTDIVYRNGVLYSGTLNALIRLMVPSENYYPEDKFVFTFLLTSRFFIKPCELLKTIVKICDSQNLDNKHPENKEILTTVTTKLLNLIQYWTQSYPYDFRDEELMSYLKSITQKCVNIVNNLLPKVTTLLQNLLCCLTNLDEYEEFLQEINHNFLKQSIDTLPLVNVMELCPEAKMLAENLCHIELNCLTHIGPEEFVQEFSNESALKVLKKITSEKKTKNLESYIQWSNRLSSLVATEICRNLKKKNRVKVIEYWIEVAKVCCNIGNFNSLMAIIAGLNLSSVARLKKTWAKVQSDKFLMLEQQMNPSSNFSSYRSMLKAAMWRSNEQQQCLVIPFFSLLIKDIYFINEGCIDKLPNGHINFEKSWQLSEQISEFMEWKRTVCPFEKNVQITTFLQTSQLLSEKALLLSSYECESPETNSEKESYKSLKNDSDP